MTSRAIDILLSQKFLPEHGGSIRWMYEVYRRWPTVVDVITHDYYNHPPRTPEMPDDPVARPAGGGDHVTDPQLRMDRRDIFINDWGLERPGRVLRYGRMTRAVWERLRNKGNRDAIIRVHCTHAVPEAASLLPLKMIHGKRLRVISYAHGEEINACCSSRQLGMIMGQAHRVVDLMLCNSSYTQQVAAKHIAPARLRVINPGVHVTEFDDAIELGRQWRQREGLEDRLIVLTVGRLDPRKNQAAVIEAIAKLASAHPNVMYVVAGEGRERPGLERLAEERGIADRVRFVGSVDGATKRALFGGCDLFVMPAIQDGPDVEGFGMVFLEAGACGKAVIAGCVGGQPDAVADGETGLVVDGTDHAALTVAMERLLSDKAGREAMGGAGRQRALGFDWPRVVQRTIGLVEELEGGAARKGLWPRYRPAV